MGTRIEQNSSGSISTFVRHHDHVFHEKFTPQIYQIPHGLNPEEFSRTDFEPVVIFLNSLYSQELSPENTIALAEKIRITLTLKTETLASFLEQMASYSHAEKVKFDEFVQKLVCKLLDHSKILSNANHRGAAARLAAIFVSMEQEGSLYKITGGDLLFASRRMDCSWASRELSTSDRFEELVATLKKDLQDSLSQNRRWESSRQCYEISNTSIDYALRVNAGEDRDVYMNDRVRLVPDVSIGLEQKIKLRWIFDPRTFDRATVKWLDSDLSGTPEFELVSMNGSQLDVAATLEVTDENGNQVRDSMVLHFKKHRSPTLTGKLFGPDELKSGEKGLFSARIEQNPLEDLTFSWSLGDPFSGAVVDSRDISETASIAELQTSLLEKRQDTTLYCRVTAYDQDNNYYTLLLEKPLSILPTPKNQREEDLTALAINTGGSVIDTRTEDNVFNTSTFDVVLDRLAIEPGALTQEHNVALLFDVSGSMFGNYRDGTVDRALQEMVFPQILEQATRGKITLHLHLYYYGSNQVFSLGQYSFELFDESSRKSALAKMKKIKISDIISGVQHLDQETLWHAMDSLVTAQDIFGKNDKKAIYALTDYEIRDKKNESGPTLNRASLEQTLRQKEIAFHPVIF